MGQIKPASPSRPTADGITRERGSVATTAAATVASRDRCGGTAILRRPPLSGATTQLPKFGGHGPVQQLLMGMGMTWLKRLLMVLGALWLISIFAGAVILWGNDWRFGAGCLVAGVTLVGSAIYSRDRRDWKRG